MLYCFFFMSFTWWCLKYIWLYWWTLLCEVYITFWCKNVQIHAVNSEDGKPHQTLEPHAFSSSGKLCFIPITKNQFTQTPVVHTTPPSQKQPYKSSFLIFIHSNFHHPLLHQELITHSITIFDSYCPNSLLLLQSGWYSSLVFMNVVYLLAMIHNITPKYNKIVTYPIHHSNDFLQDNF